MTKDDFDIIMTRFSMHLSSQNMLISGYLRIIIEQNQKGRALTDEEIISARNAGAVDFQKVNSRASEIFNQSVNL